MHQSLSSFTTEPCAGDSALGIGLHEIQALSRLAALQGHAVSIQEFDRVLTKLPAGRLSGVPLSGRIAALWCACFPGSRLRAPCWPPQPGDTPALWIAPSGTDGKTAMLVIIGTLPDGSLSYLDMSGASRLLPPEHSCQGRLLVLESGGPQLNSPHWRLPQLDRIAHVWAALASRWKDRMNR